VAALLWPFCTAAQTPPEIASILQRLDRLEQENRALAAEVKTLRAKLDAGGEAPPAADAVPDGITAPPVISLEERIRIQEKRTEELADTKVEASQKFPIRLTGMALFNAFLNSKQNGGSDYPILAAPTGTGSISA